MLLALPLGLAVGLALGAVGGGGAVLAVPLFVYLLDQDVHAATTASLAVVAVSSVAASLLMRRSGHACVRPALAFALPASAGALAGTAANRAADGDLLLVLFAPLLLAVAVLGWQRGRDESEGPAECPPATLARTVPAGLGVGLVTGFFGVGGGFLVVPALVITLQVGMRRAIATSLMVIAIVSAVALAAHLAAGNDVDWGIAAPFTATAAAGALVGAGFSARLPQRALSHAFSVLVAGVGVYLLVEAAFMGGPPGG